MTGGGGMFEKILSEGDENISQAHVLKYFVYRRYLSHLNCQLI